MTLIKKEVPDPFKDIQEFKDQPPLPTWVIALLIVGLIAVMFFVISFL